MSCLSLYGMLFCHFLSSASLFDSQTISPLVSHFFQYQTFWPPVFLLLVLVDHWEVAAFPHSFYSILRCVFCWDILTIVCVTVILFLVYSVSTGFLTSMACQELCCEVIQIPTFLRWHFTYFSMFSIRCLVHALDFENCHSRLLVYCGFQSCLFRYDIFASNVIFQ